MSSRVILNSANRLSSSALDTGAFLRTSNGSYFNRGRNWSYVVAISNVSDDVLAAVETEAKEEELTVEMGAAIPHIPAAALSSRVLDVDVTETGDAISLVVEIEVPLHSSQESCPHEHDFPDGMTLECLKVLFDPGLKTLEKSPKI